MSEEDTRDAVLAALRPQGVRESLRLRLAGGLSATQVVERLPDAVRVALGADDAVRAHRVTEEVHRILVALSIAGRVRRIPTAYGAPLGNKGPRKVLVDLFRLV